MADNYGLEMSGLDPQAYYDMLRIKRQQGVADALMKQAETPLRGTIVGKTYVAPSPLQGLAQLFSANYSGLKQGEVDAAQKALYEGVKSREAQAVDDYIRRTRGTPDVVESQPATFEGPPAPLQRGYTPTATEKMNAVAEGLLSHNKRVGNLAALDYAGHQREVERKDNLRAKWEEARQRAQERKDEIAARAAENRITRSMFASALGGGRRVNVERVPHPTDPAKTLTVDINVYDPKAYVAGNMGGVYGEEPNKAFGGEIAKPMTATETRKFREAITQDRNAVIRAMDASNVIGGEITALKKHPGLEGITGIAGMFPDMPSSSVTSGNAAAARSILTGLKARSETFGRGLESLSGKLGNMAVAEWTKVGNAVANLEKSLDNPDEFKNQLSLFKQAVDRYQNVMKNAYKTEYEDYYSKPEYKEFSVEQFPDPIDSVRGAGKYGKPPAGSVVPE